MKRLHMLLFVITVAVIVTSCDIAVVRIPLLAYEKQMIPYAKGQELRFTDEKGDTTLFTTKDIITEWKWDEAALEKIGTQYRKVNLQSESGDLISLQVNGFSYDYDPDNNEVHLMIKGIHFRLPFDCAGKFYTYAEYGSQWHVYDTLSINNRVYYDVVVEETGSNKQLYYNKTYGILQLRQNGQNIFTIQQ